MSNTLQLTTARNDKKDEFYTRYEDIELELNHYLDFNPDLFKDKVLLCPCDNPEWSNFTKYFVTNFKKLGLKKLISTCYIEDVSDGLFGLDNEVDKTKNGRVYILTKENYRDDIDVDNLDYDYLETNGDFVNVEITKYRDESDIIVTNPPFSLFRKFIVWCQPEKRLVLLIGNINSVSCKEVFPMIKKNKLWLGVTGFTTGMYFYVPDEYVYKDTYKSKREIDGRKVMRVANVCWYSNIDHKKRHELIELVDKSIDEYVKYDRYDAIDIPNINLIPKNYDQKMGVPISFLNRYNPEQFEILGLDINMEDNVIKGKRFTIDGKSIYARIIIRKI